MPHTNLSIPKYSEMEERRHLALVRAELEFWKKEAEILREELLNIPDAILQYGYIEVLIGKGGYTKMIRADREEPQEG